MPKAEILFDKESPTHDGRVPLSKVPKIIRQALPASELLYVVSGIMFLLATLRRHDVHATNAVSLMDVKQVRPRVSCASRDCYRSLDELEKY